MIFRFKKKQIPFSYFKFRFFPYQFFQDSVKFRFSTEGCISAKIVLLVHATTNVELRAYSIFCYNLIQGQIQNIDNISQGCQFLFNLLNV